MLKGWVELPGLTPAMIPKYLSKSRFTTRGHMKLIKQGLRSTHKETDDDIYPTVIHPTQQHMPLLMRVVQTPRLYINRSIQRK